MPTKFAIPPLQAGYSVSDNDTNLSVAIDGGTGRYRKDLLTVNLSVKCTWLFDATEYEYFRDFYAVETSHGAESFLIDLIIDTSELVEHEAYFVPGSIQLNRVDNTFGVNAQLDVEPVARDDDYDAALVMLYAEYGSGSESQAMLNQLEQLANVDLPGSL